MSRTRQAAVVQRVAVASSQGPRGVGVRARGGPSFADPAPVSIPSVGGRPLPAGLRGEMEARTGASFATVRTFVGDTAPRLGALAFTRGEHIHFGPGQLTAPVLRHELGHVLQQRAGRVQPTGTVGGVPLNDAPHLEAEADRIGAGHGGPMSPMSTVAAPGAIQRVLDPKTVERVADMLGVEAPMSKKMYQGLPQEYQRKANQSQKALKVVEVPTDVSVTCATPCSASPKS